MWKGNKKEPLGAVITLCYRATNPRSTAGGIYPLLGTVMITNESRR